MGKKKAYLIGIAGKTMAPLAKAFKDLGWEVSGSDHKGVYPPISIYLQENKILYVEGYDAKNIPKDADLVVVGRGALLVDPENPEYLEAKKLKLNIKSYPEVLKDYLIKENSIVVVGTYGKTTITALITWILMSAGLNPSFMIGGIPINLKDGVKITNSDYSVVEGDEPPALFETDPPKFMFYKPKYLLLTATHWDHPEVFKTEKEYLNAFIKLVEKLPNDGFLAYNMDSVKKEITEIFKGKKITYSLANSKADYFVDQITKSQEKTYFRVRGTKEIFDLETSLLGSHNLENLCGTVALCSELGIKKEIIKGAVKTFKGVKTRLEFLGKFADRYLYWDLAQHPSKVKGTLSALRKHFPENKIFAVYDPSATALKYKETLSWFKGAFDPVDQVVVGKVIFLKKITKENRVAGPDFVKAISKTQKNVFYEPVDEKIIDYLVHESRPDNVIIFLSSGGLRFINLIEKTKQILNER